MENTHNLPKKHDHDYAEIDDADEEWTEPLQLGRKNMQNCPDMGCNIPMSKLGHNRTIIHFDVDCFYAQVEMLQNPELRNKPLGIQQKNIVITTNYVARDCGVPKSTYVTEAKKICPQLVLVCGEDLTNYRQMSYRISEFLKKYTPFVERLGFDEDFIDVSELVATRLKNSQYKPEFVGHIYGLNQQASNKPLCCCGCELRLQIGSQIAAEIREALNKELGITCCAGVSYNKLLAKLVAGKHKPNQQTSLLPHLTLELMSSLSSVLCIPGIGFTKSRALNSLGITSVLELQSSNKKMLEKEFGLTVAETMVQLSFGVDDSPITAYSQPQTLSDEDSFKCCNDVTDVEHRIGELLMSLLKRIVEDGRVPQTIRLTVRRVPNKHHRETRQCPVPSHIFSKFLQSSGSSEAVVEQLMPVLMNLFHKLVDTSQPFHLTLIAVCFAKLTKPADEYGSINYFFTKGLAYPQKVVNSLHMEQVTDKQLQNVFQPISKSSPIKSEFNAKTESTLKTIKDFFYKKDKRAESTELQNLGTGNESQLSFNHQSVNVSLSTVNVKSVNCASIIDVKSVNSAFTSNQNDNSRAFSSLDKPKECSNSGESNQVISAAGTDIPENKQAGSISGLSEGCCSDGGLGNLNIKSLQKLLPSHVDVQMITELPLDIQKEVLLEYGIYVDDLSQRKFTSISNKIIKRPKNTSSQTVDKVQLFQHSPKKKNIQKRNPELSLLDGENAGRISKKIKVELTDLEPGHNPEICQLFSLRDSKIEDHITKMFSETWSKSCDKNEPFPCVRNREAQRKDYVLPFTNCCVHENKADDSAVDDSTNSRVTENNAHHSAMDDSINCSVAENNTDHSAVDDSLNQSVAENKDNYSAMDDFRKRSSDILLSFSKNISVFPAEKLGNTSSCKSHGKDTSKPVSCDYDPTDEHNFPLHTPNAQPSDRQGSSDILVISSASHAPKQSGRSLTMYPQICDQLKVSHNKLPGNIDSEVFSSLPRNIQGEIMAHIVMGGDSKSASGQYVISEHQKNLKQMKNSKCKSQNTLLTYFKNK